MFNSARQEGSTAASVTAFWGAGFLFAWMADDFFGVIDTSDAVDNTSGFADRGWSSITINAVLDGWVFWAIAALFTIGATLNCIYGLSGFNVGPRVVGPYSVLQTGE